MKNIVVGHGPGAMMEGRVLNRVVRVTEHGWEYKADQRHAEMILEAMRLNGAKPVSTPGESTVTAQPDDGKLLEPSETSWRRATLAGANHLAAERPDIMYATKEVRRTMANRLRQTGGS